MADVLAYVAAALVGLWGIPDAAQHRTTTRRRHLMASPVVHWEIGGPDLDTLARFYRELFGWETAGFDANYRLVNLDEGVGGGLMRCREGMPAYVTIYVAVDDLDATLAHVKDLGGIPLLPPTPIPGVGAFALFQDPAGNTIGILRPEM